MLPMRWAARRACWRLPLASQWALRLGAPRRWRRGIARWDLLRLFVFLPKARSCWVCLSSAHAGTAGSPTGVTAGWQCCARCARLADPSACCGMMRPPGQMELRIAGWLWASAELAQWNAGWPGASSKSAANPAAAHTTSRRHQPPPQLPMAVHCSQSARRPLLLATAQGGGAGVRGRCAAHAGLHPASAAPRAGVRGALCAGGGRQASGLGGVVGAGAAVDVMHARSAVAAKLAQWQLTIGVEKGG